MSCRDFIGFLWRYLSGELPDGERREFDRHLELCPDCMAYLRSYERTVGMAADAFDDGDDRLPEPVPEDLVYAILEARDSRI